MRLCYCLQMIGNWGALRTTSLLLLLMTAGSGSIRASALIVNGGFESGFSGWSTVDETGGATSGWNIQTGTTSPINGITVPAPPQGTHAAMTDSTGPGSHALYQSFTVTPGSTAILSFDLFAGSQAGIFTPTPESLDFNAIPNQQARVDILAGATTVANAFSLTSVVDNVFDPSVATSSYTPYSFDITSAVGAGGTFTLRFAEVDNLAIFNLGVDNVSIVTSQLATPEPSSALIVLTFAALFVGLSGKSKARSGRRFDSAEHRAA